MSDVIIRQPSRALNFKSPEQIVKEYFETCVV